MILSSYAAMLALFYIFLSFYVIKYRRKKKVSLGDGEDAELQRAIRAHANFSEYVPLTLLLIFFCETQGLPPILVHTTSILLLLSRCGHAYGVINKSFNFRILGMVGTFLVMIKTALYLLVQTI